MSPVSKFFSFFYINKERYFFKGFKAKYGNQLITVLDKCKSLMDDLKVYYNTPNSKVIINVIEEYLSNKQTYVKEYYLPVNDRVKMITNEYTSLHNDVADTVK